MRVSKFQLQDHNHLKSITYSWFFWTCHWKLSAESPTNPVISLGKTGDLRKLLRFVTGMKGENVLLEGISGCFRCCKTARPQDPPGASPLGPLHQGSALDPLGGLQRPQDPQLRSLHVAPNSTCTSIKTPQISGRIVKKHKILVKKHKVMNKFTLKMLGCLQ